MDLALMQNTRHNKLIEMTSIFDQAQSHGIDYVEFDNRSINRILHLDKELNEYEIVESYLCSCEMSKYQINYEGFEV